MAGAGHGTVTAVTSAGRLPLPFVPDDPADYQDHDGSEKNTNAYIAYIVR